MEQSRFAGLCYFCSRIKKNQLTMIQLSKKNLILFQSQLRCSLALEGVIANTAELE